jgi:MFS family permease
LFAPAIGNWLPKIGHKNSLLYGLAVMAFSTCLYSVGSFFENDGLFYGISYMGRLF